MKKIITSIALTVTVFCAKAQIAPTWANYVNYYNTQNYDVVNASTGVDSVGNVYTAASVYDTTVVNNKEKIMLVKYNAAGVQQWIKYYIDLSDAGNSCYVSKVLVDKAGNSYVCGYGRHDNATSIDFMVAKYDNTGFQQWIRYFDGGQSIGDYLTCAKFDNAGNIIIAGNSNFQGSTQYDISVVKFGISGTQLWSYTYNNSFSNFDDNVYDMAIDLNNNIFITGNTYVTNARNMLTIKLNSNGVNQWTNIVAHTNSGTDENGFGITTDALGNCYVTGTLSDWATIKYNSAGAIVWTNHQPAAALNPFSTKHILLDKFNNVVIASDAFYVAPNFSDLEVNKINNVNGTTIWTTHYNFGGVDQYASMQKDTADNIYIAGYFEGSQGSDMSTLVLSTSGSIVWNTTFTNPNLAIGGDRSYQLILDNNKNIIIVASAERRGSGSSNAVDVLTLKYGAISVGLLENKLQETQFNVYPNPCKNTLTLSTENLNLVNATVIITNILGETVLEKKLINLTDSINLESVGTGVYTIKIIKDDLIASKKIIIE